MVLLSGPGIALPGREHTAAPAPREGTQPVPSLAPLGGRWWLLHCAWIRGGVIYNQGIRIYSWGAFFLGERVAGVTILLAPQPLGRGSPSAVVSRGAAMFRGGSSRVPGCSRVPGGPQLSLLPAGHGAAPGAPPDAPAALDHPSAWRGATCREGKRGFTCCPGEGRAGDRRGWPGQPAPLAPAHRAAPLCWSFPERIPKEGLAVQTPPPAAPPGPPGPTFGAGGCCNPH